MRFSILILLFHIIMSTNASDNTSEKPVLQYLIREPKTASAKPPVLILLHGVGSNEADLFALADYIPDNVLVISARAPFTLGHNSYAWFEVDFSSGKPVGNVEQEAKSRLMLLQFIEQMKKLYWFDSTQLYLGGFSQGAIMSYSIGLSHPEKVKGLMILSGRLLEQVRPNIASYEQLKHLRIFISHGINDPVLTIQYARESVAYIKDLGLNPIYKEYNAVHTINNDMLTDLLKWLAE